MIICKGLTFLDLKKFSKPNFEKSWSNYKIYDQLLYFY